MIALIYDVHGNLPALEAVLADAEGAGARGYVLGGDYALFGAWPRETVERLRALPGAEWLRGNGERWTAAPAEAPGPVQGAIAACRELLGEDLVADMAELPETLPGEATLFCHGSPRSDVESFMPEPYETDEELLEGVEAQRVVFGHTHIQFRREGPRGIELVNPGSVGMPFDGDTRAAYALVHDGGEVEHRRVAYDHQASAAAVRERLGADGEVVARRIEQATFVQ